MAANTARSVLKNTGFLTAGELINKLGAVILAAVVARKLGPEDFGAFSVAMVLAAMVAPLADPGIAQIVFRDGAASSDEAASLTGAGIGLRILLLPVVGAMLPLLFFLLGYDRSLLRPVVLIGLGVLIASVAQVYHSLFRAQSVTQLEAASFLVRLPVVCAMAAWVWFSSAGLEEVASVYLLSSILAALAPAVAGQCAGVVPAWPCAGQLPRLLRRAAPLGLQSAMVVVQTQVSVLVLSRFHPLAAVGFLQAASRLTLSLNLVGKSVSAALLPHLMRFDQQASAQLENSYYRTVKYLVGLALPIAVGTTVLARPIIELIYGSEFGPAVLPLRILVWTGALVFWGYASGAVLLARDRRWALSQQGMACGAFSILISLVLVPTWGVPGAAVATLLTEVLAVGFYAFHLRRVGVSLPRRLCGDVATCLSGCGVMTLALWVTAGLPLLLRIPLGAGVYLLSLWLMRFLDRGESLIARRLLGALESEV